VEENVSPCSDRRGFYLNSLLDERVQESLTYSSTLIHSIHNLRLRAPMDTTLDHITLPGTSISMLYAIAFSDRYTDRTVFADPGRILVIAENPEKLLYGKG
jgi:hypothetical protein